MKIIFHHKKKKKELLEKYDEEPIYKGRRPFQTLDTCIVLDENEGLVDFNIITKTSFLNIVLLALDLHAL